MFIGHFAVALAAKRMTPRMPLAALFASAQFPDLIWPVFLLAGLEHVRVDPGNTAFTPLDFYNYPFSHSLVGSTAWALMFGLLCFYRTKSLRDSIVIGSLVVSHWVLDLVTHRPDLPLMTNASPKVGLALWNNVPATIATELLLLAAGIWLYAITARPKNKAGVFVFTGLIAFLVLINVMNILGPPPPGMDAIAIAGNLMWLIVLWGWWVDRTWTSRTP